MKLRAPALIHDDCTFPDEPRIDLTNPFDLRPFSDPNDPEGRNIYAAGVRADGTARIYLVRRPKLGETSGGSEIMITIPPEGQACEYGLRHPANANKEIIDQPARAHVLVDIATNFSEVLSERRERMNRERRTGTLLGRLGVAISGLRQRLGRVSERGSRAISG